MSTSTEYMDSLNMPAERRFYPRVTPPTPTYVAFGSNNLGVLHNVSENGFQVVTPGELPVNSVYRVFLSLNGAAKTISVTVRTIWTTSTDKRAGIQLLDLADEDRQQIRQWVELELSRNEKSSLWALPKSGDQAPTSSQRGERLVPRNFDGTVLGGPTMDRQPINRQPVNPVNEVRPAAAPVASRIPDVAPPPLAPAARTPRAAVPPPPVPPVVQSPVVEPAVAAYAAEANTELPPIANPFDDPGPNPKFEQFPSVPLPIHGEFEYGKKISGGRRRVSTWSSHLRTKPLILWAVALALLCVGANALVKHKIKQNARRFAHESAAYVPPKSDLEQANSHISADDSGANAVAPASGATDSPSTTNADTNTEQQSATPVQSNAAAASPQNDSQSATNAMTSRPAANQPPLVPRRESSLDADARQNQAYSPTAPRAIGRSEQAPNSSEPATTPRTWSAPAPTRSSSTVANDAPQSPNVVSSSNNVNVQSAPIVSQTRPTPPPAPSVQASNPNTAVSSPTASNSSGAVNNAPARTPSSNTQSSTYAANTSNNNATPTRPQSPIYNANTPQQRSAIIGSINSVHSSGIFDSNDSKAASVNAAPVAAPRGSANANVGTRPVASKDVIPTDTPQERDIEIAAPKGFSASYVDLPGEHVVRAAGTTIHIRRFVRVPGERVPGQRWLWKGRLNVSLGDVVNRIDPSVVQASGASGSLTVQATIDKDGYVTDVKPLYGNFGMLPSVSRAVRNWHYDPTYLDSKRAETQAQIEFNVSPTAATSAPLHR